jgi:hypothetical protein
MSSLSRTLRRKALKPSQKDVNKALKKKGYGKISLSKIKEKDKETQND